MDKQDLIPIVALVFALLIMAIVLEVKETKKLKKIIKKHDEQLSNESFYRTKYHNERFRIGDEVFTSDSQFELNKPYYIVSLYNGFTEVGCALISPNKTDTITKPSHITEFNSGVKLLDLQFERFPSCPCCKQNL